MSAQKQITAEDNRSKIEFLRDQQRSVYADYLVDEQNLADLERDFYTVLLMGVSPLHRVVGQHYATVKLSEIRSADELEMLRRGQQPIQEGLDKLEVDFANIQLVASKKAAVAAQEMIESHRSVHGRFKIDKADEQGVGAQAW